MIESFNLALEVLKQSRKILVLTGAGISVSAGIPCFTGTGSSSITDIFSRRKLIKQAKPTLAHKILAKWEPRFPEFLLVTQNIDNLHRLAGSNSPLEFHGNINDEIVNFGKSININSYVQALTFAMNCDLCLIIGTSLTVLPFANIPSMAAIHGAPIININLDKNEFSSAIFLNGAADDILQKLDTNWK